MTADEKITEVVLNVFCPTGPGGGIRPNCGAKGAGGGMKAPDRIRKWVEKSFNAKQVDKVFQDLLDVATGNRPGNKWETTALKKIFPEYASTL